MKDKNHKPVSEGVKNKAKLLVKLIVTGVAIWVVLRKVDVNDIAATISTVNFGYLFLALLVFVVSKIFAAIRLKYFFKEIDVQLSTRYNFRLYLIGMFHNLYLPGGVGGDGYKVYLINKESKTPVKKLISAVLFDRINGLAALFTLALLLSLTSSIRLVFEQYEWVGWMMLVLAYPVYFLLAKKLFANYHQHLWKTTGLSLLTQGIQLICTFFLLMSLGVAGNIMEYQALFMLASILTIVPITFGGIGVREMVFIASYQMLGLDREVGVSFSLLFFVITAMVSFSGAFLGVKPKEKEDIAWDEEVETSKSN